MTKEQALLLVVGGLLVWSYSGLSFLPPFPFAKNGVAMPDAQKSGFPAQEDMPDYQTAVESNEGQTPSYTSNSAFGK